MSIRLASSQKKILPSTPNTTAELYRYATEIANSDKITDYGQFKVVVDIDSQPFLEEATLDYTKEGINEFFKIVNPKETATCGCGVSIGFA